MSTRVEGIMNESKNRVNLSDVSDKFTEKVLADVLRKTCNGKKVRLTNWEFGEEFAKGDSYLSTVNKGKLHGVMDDSPWQQVRVSFVVKSIPKNVGRRKTFRSGEFFSNEIIFYTKVRVYETFLLHNLKYIYLLRKNGFYLHTVKRQVSLLFYRLSPRLKYSWPRKGKATYCTYHVTWLRTWMVRMIS